MAVRGVGPVAAEGAGISDWGIPHTDAIDRQLLVLHGYVPIHLFEVGEGGHDVRGGHEKRPGDVVRRHFPADHLRLTRGKPRPAPPPLEPA